MALTIDWVARDILRDAEGAAHQVCFQVTCYDPDSLNHRQQPHRGIVGGIHRLTSQPKGLTETEAIDLVQQELSQRERQNIEYSAKMRRERLEYAEARKAARS